MTTFKALQDEVLQILHGYGLDQARASFLASSVTSSSLTFTLNDASAFDQGVAEVEGELVYVESVDRAANTITIASDGRGYLGTTAAAHNSGVRVTFSPVWPRNRVKAAINDTIVGTHPLLFGVAQTQFTFNPTQSTYSLPAEAERVLTVQADTLGPSREQQQVRRYAFNSVSPTDEFATTNSITLHEGVIPGRTVTVTYMKRPSALVADADELSTSGLAESAKLTVVYGACAQLLSFYDITRLHVDTARADEYDEKVQVGMATRIAGQLELRYQQELDKERRRLRQATPVPITMRRR